MDEAMLVWTGYMRYRVRLRGFDLATIEHIVRYFSERYIDTATGRLVAVGRHDQCLVMVPYKREGNVLTPVTIHVTAEINAKGELIGIEILNASKFVRDSVLESVQAKVLDLAEAKTA